jgi:hypothetical protein
MRDDPALLLALESRHHKLALTILAREGTPGTDANACRDEYVAGISRTLGMAFRLEEHGDLPLAMRDVALPAPFDGLVQRSWSAFIARDGVCLTLHFSLTPFAPEDREAAKGILGSFRTLD